MEQHFVEWQSKSYRRLVLNIQKWPMSH